MIKFLAITAAAISLSTPAHAGSIAITVTTTVTGAQTKTFTIPDAQIARAFAAYKAAQGQVCDNASPPVCGAPSNAQTFTYIATRIVSDMVAITRDYEQRQSHSTVTDIQPQ